MTIPRMFYENVKQQEESVLEQRSGNSLSESFGLSSSTSNNFMNDGKYFLKSNLACLCNQSAREAKAGETQVKAVWGAIVNPKLDPLCSKII